jgi:ATP-binding cassette subfamily B (MDR/TAP) protein 8
MCLQHVFRGALTAGDLMRFLVSSQTIQRALSQTSVLFGQVPPLSTISHDCHFKVYSVLQVVRGMSAGTRVFEYMESIPTIPVEVG